MSNAPVPQKSILIYQLLPIPALAPTRRSPILTLNLLLALSLHDQPPPTPGLGRFQNVDLELWERGGIHRAEAEDKVSTQPHEYREGLEALPLPGLTNKGHMAKEKCKVRWPHEDSPFHRKGGHSSDTQISFFISCLKFYPIGH